jgi:hypothetical protein
MRVTLNYIYLFFAKLFKKAKMSKKRKRKFIISFIAAFFIYRSAAQGAPLPGAYGFQNIKPPQCRNYGIQSRVATGISTTVRESPTNNNDNQSNKKNVSYYCSELDCIFDSRQIQAKYKHAPLFGVEGNYNPINGGLFREALIDNMRQFKPILGTYHGKEVYHYLDPESGLNVMMDKKLNASLVAGNLVKFKKNMY